MSACKKEKAGETVRSRAHVHMTDSQLTADDGHAETICQMIDVIINQHIGEETSYQKFIQKNKHTDPDCLRKVNAISEFNGLIQQIQDILETCKSMGQERISTICNAVLNTTQCAFSMHRRWGMCELTGNVTNSCLVMYMDDSQICVDAEHESFFLSLWMISHVSVLEKNRVDRFLCNLEGCMSISDAIEEYKASQYMIGSDDISTYNKSLQVVLRVLTHTMNQITSYKPTQNIHTV